MQGEKDKTPRRKGAKQTRVVELRAGAQRYALRLVGKLRSAEITNCGISEFSHEPRIMMLAVGRPCKAVPESVFLASWRLCVLALIFSNPVRLRMRPSGEGTACHLPCLDCGDRVDEHDDVQRQIVPHPQQHAYLCYQQQRDAHLHRHTRGKQESR